MSLLACSVAFPLPCVIAVRLITFLHFVQQSRLQSAHFCVADHRRELATNGWKDLSNAFIDALVLDLIY